MVVVFRCTRKLRDRFHDSLRYASAPSTGLLGDWYVTLLVTQPHLLLFVSEATRLPVVLPARQLSTMTARFTEALGLVLLALDVSTVVVARELAAMDDAIIAPTQNRSILGTMNDFSDAVRWALHDEPALSLHQLSLELAETPIRPLADFPARATRRSLAERPMA